MKVGTSCIATLSLVNIYLLIMFGCSTTTTSKHVLEGNNYKNSSKFDNAIESYTKAIIENPNDVDAYNGRGWAYHMLGNESRCIEDYSIAINCNPRLRWLFANRGLCYRSMKNYPQAISDFSQAINIDSKNSDVYQKRGWTYFKLNENQKCIEDYNEALKLDPSDHISLYYRGRCHYNSDNFQKANEDLTQAIALNGKDHDYFFERGRIYYSLKADQKAIDDYSNAIALNSKHSFSYRNRGSIYKKLNMIDDMCFNYAKACEYGECEELEKSKRNNLCLNADEILEIDKLIAKLREGKEETRNEAVSKLSKMGKKLSESDINMIINIMRSGKDEWETSNYRQSGHHCTDYTYTSIKYYAANALLEMKSPYVGDEITREAKQIKSNSTRTKRVTDPGWV